MKIQLNGTETLLAGGLSLAGLLEQLGLPADRVAVEHNRAIVGRDAFVATVLADGDTLEIVRFVGGG